MFPQRRSSRSAPNFLLRTGIQHRLPAHAKPLVENSAAMARRAYEYALGLLSARSYTSRNLRRKLIQKAFPPDEVEEAMERLVGARLLDDQQYAHDYARQKLVTGGSSVRRVEQDLVRRGVAAEEIRAAITAVMEEEDVDMARSIDVAARKKLASMNELGVEVKRRRLFGFLARGGFETSSILRVIEKILSNGGP